MDALFFHSLHFDQSISNSSPEYSNLFIMFCNTFVEEN